VSLIQICRDPCFGIWPASDRQTETDGRAIAYSALSIICYMLSRTNKTIKCARWSNRCCKQIRPQRPRRANCCCSLRTSATFDAVLTPSPTRQKTVPLSPF